MSNKADLVTMNQEKKRELKPNLRFPEFCAVGEWEEEKLIDVTDKKIKWSFIGGPFGSNLKSSDYTTHGIRIIQLQNIGDAEFINDHKIFTTEQKANELLSCNIYPGEIILSKMGDPVGRACLIPNKHPRYLMCSDGIRLVVDEQLFSKYFIYSLINSDSFRKLVDKTATGSTRKRIGLDDLKNLPMVVPKLKEQKKIADCLSSLGDRITAETQKLDTLKTHKRGLMQQLFPAEGETLPKLRFPEFRNAGEWEVKKLGDFGEFKNGINFSADKKGSGTLTVDVLNMYGSRIETKLDSLYRVDVDAKDYLLKDGDILFVRSSMKREGIGWASLFRDFSEPVLFCGFLIRLRLKSFESTNPEFLLYYLRSDFGRNKIISVSGTAAITNISQDSLKIILTPLPTFPEQKRIADCLSSLDELVAAQTQKIDTLKTHKKGLMQQLFPALDEVKA